MQALLPEKKICPLLTRMGAGPLVGTYKFGQEFSLASALKNGIYSGLTMFGVSLVYDGSQNHLTDQLKRLNIFEKKLENISLDDYSVKLKF